MKYFVWFCLFFWGNAQSEVFLNGENTSLPTGIVSQIHFENEDESLKDVLNSFLLLKEGESFTLQKLEKTKERLMTLGWYQKIDIFWNEDENNPHEYIVNIFFHKNLIPKSYLKLDYTFSDEYLKSESFFRLNRFFSYPFSLSFLVLDREYYRNFELKFLYIKDYEYSYGFDFNIEYDNVKVNLNNIYFDKTYYKNKFLLNYKKSFLDIFEATFYLGSINIFDNVEYGYWTIGLSAKYNHLIKKVFFEEGILWSMDIQHGWTEKYHESPFSKYDLSFKWSYLPSYYFSLHGNILLETIETVSPYWENSLLKMDSKILSQFKNNILLGTRTFFAHHEMSFLFYHINDFSFVFSLYGENFWIGRSQNPLLREYENDLFSIHGSGGEISWKWKGWEGVLGGGTKYQERFDFLGYALLSFHVE